MDIKRLLFVIAHAFISKTFAGIGVLALNLLLGRYYGVDGIGYFMLNLSLLVGLSLFARVGMDNVLIRDLTLDYANGFNEEYWHGVLSALAWCFLSSMLLIICCILLMFIFKLNLSLPMLLALPFYSFIYLQSSMLKSVGLAGIAPIFETGSVALLLCLVIIVGHSFGLEHVGDIEWPFFFASVLVFLLGMGLLFNKYFYLDKRKVQISNMPSLVVPWKRFKGLGSFVVLSGNAYLGQWGVILLLGLFLSQADVGAFTLAHRIALLISFVLIVVNGVASPKFALHHSLKDTASLQKLVHNIFWIGSAAAVAVFFALVLAGKALLSVFITEVDQVYYLLMVLGVTQVINVMTGPSTYLLMMTNNENFLKKYMLTFSFSVLLLLAVVAKWTNVELSAITFAAVEITKNILLVYFVYRLLALTIIPMKIARN